MTFTVGSIVSRRSQSYMSWSVSAAQRDGKIWRHAECSAGTPGTDVPPVSRWRPARACLSRSWRFLSPIRPRTIRDQLRLAGVGLSRIASEAVRRHPCFALSEHPWPGDQSTPAEARRLIGGDNVLTVWATARVQTVSGQCAARQVIGVWSDQRRKVRGYSSGKFCVTRRSRSVHRTNSLDRAFENLMELGPEDVGSGDYASFVATPDGLLPATWAERIPSPEA